MSVTERALHVLTLVGESQRGLSLSDISDNLELPLPTAHRLLKTLTEAGWVARHDETLEYHPGRRLLRVSSLVRRGTLSGVADESLRGLSRRFNETVMLSQLFDNRAVCVGLAESRRPLHLSVSVGRDVPLHAAASARVLYSDRDDDQVAALLHGYDFTRLLPDTPASLEAVLEHLHGIRERGYDVCDNEFDRDVWAVAAPVYGSDGSVVAGVTLTLPQERSQAPGLRDDIIHAVTDAAGDIGLAIGGYADRAMALTAVPR
jgi:DNA-binding IclR family transcriptional regulator